MSEVVMVGNVRYVPEVAESEIKIVVLDRGWVVVGYVSYKDGFTFIDRGAVIRNWGTTRGLGEIAADGPTANTNLDFCPTVKAKNPIFEMNCEGEKWKTKLQ